MFSVEFEPDASVIVSLDENDDFEDVEMVLADEGVVYLRQYENGLDEYQLIVISYQQFVDLYASMKSTEGFYKVEDIYGVFQ